MVDTRYFSPAFISLFVHYLGICPLLAPTKNSLDDAKIPPLTAPKVEQATKKGMIHDMTPSNRFPNV